MQVLSVSSVNPLVVSYIRATRVNQWNTTRFSTHVLPQISFKKVPLVQVQADAAGPHKHERPVLLAVGLDVHVVLERVLLLLKVGLTLKGVDCDANVR